MHFFLRAENASENYLEEYISLNSIFSSLFLVFFFLQKAVDEFSANSAAAYRSFFSFFIIPCAALSITATWISYLFPFVMYLLIILWYLKCTTITKFMIWDLRLSIYVYIPKTISPTLIIVSTLITNAWSFHFNKPWNCKLASSIKWSDMRYKIYQYYQHTHLCIFTTTYTAVTIISIYNI